MGCSLIESPEIKTNPSKAGVFIQPKNLSAQDAQGDLFRSRLNQILSNGHPLFQLARQIVWSFFDTEFGGQVTGSGVVVRSCRRHLE